MQLGSKFPYAHTLIGLVFCAQQHLAELITSGSLMRVTWGRAFCDRNRYEKHCEISPVALKTERQQQQGCVLAYSTPFSLDIFPPYIAKLSVSFIRSFPSPWTLWCWRFLRKVILSLLFLQAFPFMFISSLTVLNTTSFLTMSKSSAQLSLLNPELVNQLSTQHCLLDVLLINISNLTHSQWKYW